MTAEVILRFRNKQEKDKFLKGLADGFGEEYCQLFWGEENNIKLTDSKIVDIIPWGPFEDDDEEEFDDFGLQKMKGEE